MSVPSTSNFPAPQSYEIKPVTESDTEPILDHLRNSFFKDEPLNDAVKLIEFENSTCVELEHFASSSIHEGTSFMAVASSGTIIGACLNNFLWRNIPEEHEDDCPNPKFAKILKLLSVVDKQADVFAQFPEVNKIINVKILSVDGAWRGKGIGKELMNRTRNIAREQGCGLMRVDCSSHFSARAIAKLGFDCIYSLKHEEYLENGKPVFSPEEPHKEVKIYVQKIYPEQS